MTLPPVKIRTYLVLYRTTGGEEFNDKIDFQNLLKDAAVSKMEKKEKLYYHLLGTMTVQENNALYLKDAPNRRKKNKDPSK